MAELLCYRARALAVSVVKIYNRSPLFAPDCFEPTSKDHAIAL